MPVETSSLGAPASFELRSLGIPARRAIAEHLVAADWPDEEVESLTGVSLDEIIEIRAMQPPVPATP